MAKGTGKEATGLAGQSAPPAGQCEEGAAAEAASASQCEAAPTPAIPAASSRGRRTEPPPRPPAGGPYSSFPLRNFF